MVREIIGRISDLSDRGYGVLEAGDIKIEVPGALPGELVRVKVGRKKLGRIIDIIERNPARILPPCPYVGMCGGCLWQDVSYSEQLRLKQMIIEKIFERIIGEFDIADIIPAQNIFGYRGKMEFIFSGSPESLTVGLRTLGRYDRVVDIHSCWLQNQLANIVLQEFRQKLSLLGYKPYNIITHRGFLRYLVIRSSFYENSCLVNIVTTSERKLDIDILVQDTYADTVIWSTSDSLADVAMGEIRAVHGRGYIYEKALGYVFRVYPYAFYQTNPVQAEVLFDFVRKMAGGGERALDLYCGIGTIALIVSDNFSEIIGIEIEKSAVKAAQENAEMNDVDNVRFIEGKVEEKIWDINKKIDVVFVDPPRAGIHKRALKAIIDLKPDKIVYVSCNPRSQAEDITHFLANGYSIRNIQPIDMLPHTPHIENICVLEKT